MPQNEADAVDFRPFFDAAIGMLFVLLILIAAQLFFAQWGPVPQETAEQKKIRAAQELDKQAAAFLRDLQHRLNGNGIAAAIDLVDRSLSVPLRALLTADANALPDAGARLPDLAGILGGRLQCVRAGAVDRPADCPPADRLTLSRLRGELRLGEQEKAPLQPDRLAQYLAIAVFSAMVRAAPDLLAVSASDGSPAVSWSSSVVGREGAGKNVDLSGDLLLRFTFE